MKYLLGPQCSLRTSISLRHMIALLYIMRYMYYMFLYTTGRVERGEICSCLLLIYIQLATIIRLTLVDVSCYSRHN